MKHTNREKSDLIKRFKKENSLHKTLINDFLEMPGWLWCLWNKSPLSLQLSKTSFYLSYQMFSKDFLSKIKSGYWKVNDIFYPYYSLDHLTQIFSRSGYDFMRDSRLCKIVGYTLEFLNSPDNKNTYDHPFIPQQALSRMILELLILKEYGVYSFNDFMFNMCTLDQVIGSTKDQNQKFKKNLDECGLRHFNNYDDIELFDEFQDKNKDFNDIMKPVFLTDGFSKIAPWTNRSLLQDKKAIWNRKEPSQELIDECIEYVNK